MADVAEWLMILAATAHLAACLISVAWAWIFDRRPSAGTALVGCVVALTASLLLAIFIFSPGGGSTAPVVLFRWMSLGGLFPLDIPIELHGGELSAVLLCVVNLVAAGIVVNLLSTDSSPDWFGPLLSLQMFAASMLLLSTNFLVIFLFWHAAGVAGLLLYSLRSDGLNRAIATRRVGLSWLVTDIPLALGVFLTWLSFGSLDTTIVLRDPSIIAELLARNPAMISVICFCLLAAAAGRCAQFPVLGWLDAAADASTSTSALLQTATLMPGAAYLLLLGSPLFVLSPDASMLLSLLGALTAFLAAWVAVSQTRVAGTLGYSTASHIGFVFVALGTGTSFGLNAAAYHLSTHSLIKAGLFIAAANLMLRTAETGSTERLKWLQRGAFFAGALLLCSGCLGQNAVLLAIREVHPVTAGDATVAAAGGLTESSVVPRAIDWLCTFALALQTLALFRAMFHLLPNGPDSFSSGDIGDADAMPTSSAPSVLGCIASAFLILVGAVAVPLAFLRLRFGSPAFVLSGVENDGLSIAIGLLIVVCAWMFYSKPRRLPESVQQAIEPLGRLGRSRFYLDDVYVIAAAQPLRGVALLCGFFDRLFVNRWGTTPARLQQLVARAAQPMQNQATQFYVLSLLMAATSLSAIFLWFQG